jgi:hypothetical protein
VRIFGEDGWTGRTTATLTDEFAEPLAVRGNIPVAVLSSIATLVITLPTKGRQLLRTDCDWNVSDARQARKTLFAEVGESPPEGAHHGAVFARCADADRRIQAGAHGPGGSRGVGPVGRLLMGSVSTGLVHHAHRPVAVIRAEEAPAANQNAPVLLGIDGSPASEAATAWAFEEASRLGVPLVALHVWSDVGVFPILGMDWRKYESQGESTKAKERKS